MKSNFKKLLLPVSIISVPLFSLTSFIACENNNDKYTYNPVQEDKENIQNINLRLNGRSEFLSTPINKALGIKDKVNSQAIITFNNGTTIVTYNLKYKNSQVETIVNPGQSNNSSVKAEDYEIHTHNYQIAFAENSDSSIYNIYPEDNYYKYTLTKVAGHYIDNSRVETNISGFNKSELNKAIQDANIQLKIKGLEKDNSYVVPNYLVENKYYSYTASDNKKYLLVYHGNYLSSNKLVNVNERTTETNKDLQTTRNIEWSTYTLVDNKWVLLIGAQTSNYYDTVINFSLLDKIDTKFNKSIAKPIKIDWNQLKNISIDAEITSWSDGDTLNFKVAKDIDADSVLYNEFHDSFVNQEIHRLRIVAIDTPEKSVGSNRSTEFEYQYAELPSKFAMDNLPAGTRIKIFFQGAGSKDTFGRYTGEVFFGDNFEYNYSTELINAGLTLPLIEIQEIKGALNNKSTALHYTVPYLADAFNEAIAARRGFYVNFLDAYAVNSTIYIQKPSLVFAWLDKNSDLNIYNTGWYEKYINLHNQK
ncbi:thermonuclease family protein [Mycoplasma sp. 1018B]|uniref:thermonuclease family protein n=1 Tax=Mycoplasma sp. 1018B TaxID=2967302 RepID=UPI00211BB40C|nr:hypothetical protein [Mycoplasma sp. 1018B]UUM19366.1 hypothetical protein NPA14_00615 [Mycoplasma sp. 1018B]